MSKEIIKGTIKAKLTLERFVDNEAVLVNIEDGSEILLPRALMPRVIREGDELVLSIETKQSESDQKEKMAKEILNEIMNV